MPIQFEDWSLFFRPMREKEPCLYEDDEFESYLNSKLNVTLPYEARDSVHLLIFGVLSRLESAWLSSSALFRSRLYMSVDAITRAVLEGGVYLYGTQRVNDPLMYAQNLFDYVPEVSIPKKADASARLPRRIKGRATYIIQDDGSPYRDQKQNLVEANLRFLLPELNKRFNGIHHIYQILSSAAHIDGTLKDQVWIDTDTDTERSPATVTTYRKGALSNITFTEERRVVARFEAVCIFTATMIDEAIARFRP